MQLGTKEFHDMIENFENNFKHMRLDKEPEDLWNMGQIYQNGETNNAFHSYSVGYAFARVVYR